MEYAEKTGQYNIPNNSLQEITGETGRLLEIHKETSGVSKEGSP